MDANSIPFEQWCELADTVVREGTGCREFDELQVCYPNCQGNAYEQMIGDKLAKIETRMLG